MKKIPSIDMKDIEKVVYDYTQGVLAAVHNGKARTNGEYVTTPEEYLAAYTKYDRDLTHEEVARSLSYILATGILDKDSKRLCHLLINNPRYVRKMKHVFDGSYRNNRIWFDCMNHRLWINCDYSQTKPYDRPNFDGKSVKYQLNWMWNHYDEIYFQIPLYHSVAEVLDDIRLHQELLCF